MKLNIKALRDRQNLTQTELARLCDMSVENLQKIEQGRSQLFRGEHFDLLCNALDCGIEELITVEKPKSTNRKW